MKITSKFATFHEFNIVPTYRKIPNIISPGLIDSHKDFRGVIFWEAYIVGGLYSEGILY